MSERIEWAKGSRRKVKAEDAFGELERIREETGTLTPQGIVDESKPEEAVLHPEFDWDDEHAANEWRKEQARNIVQTLRVVEERDGGVETSAPALVSVVVDGERGYQPTRVAFADADAAEFVLCEALEALRAWQRRYAALRAQGKLASLWNAIDEVVNG